MLEWHLTNPPFPRDPLCRPTCSEVLCSQPHRGKDAADGESFAWQPCVALVGFQIFMGVLSGQWSCMLMKGMEKMQF